MMTTVKYVWRSNAMVRFRKFVADFRRRFDPFYRGRTRNVEAAVLRLNQPYERGDEGLYYPPIMGLEETLGYLMDHKCSMSRFGDGEFALVAGHDMLFEIANGEMQRRLIEILEHPTEGCLVCIPDNFASLSRYEDRDLPFWRGQAVANRECIFPYFHPSYKTHPPRRMFGDTQITRSYMGIRDKMIAPKIFELWKRLVEGQDLLIVEGRYSRLGIGNDLFDGASSIRRIWCPPTGAFSHYAEIATAVKRHARKGDLILLALGATATIMAYDLSKDGYRALDTGHLDIEYMWMKMGAKDKVPVPGKYMSEVAGGHGHFDELADKEAYGVVAEIG